MSQRIATTQEDSEAARENPRVAKVIDFARCRGELAEQGKVQRRLAVFDSRTGENVPRKPLYYRVIKRLFDIVFSSLVIVLGFIPGLILSAIIALDTKASPIYSSIRVGSKGPFKFYKFRTMVADSDNLEKYLTPEQLDQWHREHKVDNDPRVTRLGRALRAISIDEFPQFINVFLGQISIIGPRCITEEELGFLGKDRDLYLSVPSGITGAWQIGDRNAANWQNGTRQAIELDYVRKASLKADFGIFLGTFGAMFVKRTGK